MRIHGKMAHHAQRGFSMIELLIAALVLLFGISALVQLVPYAMQTNVNSKQDSTSVVIAERLLDQMISQPLAALSFTNADGQICSLGNPAAPNVFVGHAVINQSNRAAINFAVPGITAGYGYNWRDPNDPTGAGYEIRFAVLTRTSAGAAVHKRFVVGVWKRGLGGQNVRPVTMEAALGR